MQPSLNSLNYIFFSIPQGFPGVSDGKESAHNVRDPGLIPGEGNGNPLQYFCLENTTDGGGWRGYIPWGHKGLETTQ